jgi:hypothetical protein
MKMNKVDDHEDDDEHDHEEDDGETDDSQPLFGSRSVRENR